MEDLKIFNLDEIKELIKNEKNIVVQYIDYDRKGKIFSSITLDNIDENFYKLYIFNENFMITAFNFGDGIIKYSEIKKENISNSKIEYYYLNDGKRLKVRIGNIGERSVFQYIGIEGGRDNG